MMSDAPGTLEERARAIAASVTDDAFLAKAIIAGEVDYFRVVRSALAALTEAADEIASLRARVEVLEGALTEAENVFALVEHPSFTDPDHQERIEALGSQIGYGAMMAGASAAWRKSGIIPGGEFVAGPCQATVTRTLEIIRQALNTTPSTGEEG